MHCFCSVPFSQEPPLPSGDQLSSQVLPSLFLSTANRSKLDFPDLSRLGHFLKGSSAALGLRRVTESCERLQHFGNRKDATGVKTITNEEAEDLIRALLVQVRDEYNEAKNYLTVFYDGEEGLEEES